MNFLRTRHSFFVAALSATSFSLAASIKDVRLVSSTEQSVVLEYAPLFHEPRDVTDGFRIYQHWVFESAKEWENAAPGDPALYFRGMPLALPGLTGHTVEVLAAEYETIDGVALQPVPRVEGDFDQLRKSYAVNAAAYAVNDFLPANLVEFVNTGIVRGYATGELRVSPVQYNPATGHLRKYTRIVVRVNFGPATFRRRSGAHDPLIKDVLLNYATAKDWLQEPPEGRTMEFRSSVFKNGPWFRFSITENGMYKIDGSTLLAAGVPASTDPQTIRIFSNGGIEPPDNPSVPYPDDPAEAAVYVSDGGTPGALDPADYINFYGQSPRSWRYQPSTRAFHHTINLYTEVTYYWITYGGVQSKQMAMAQSLSDPNPFSPLVVVGKVFREDERVNVQTSGRQWLGQSLNPGDALTYLFSLPGFDSSGSVTYRFAVGARNTISSSLYTVTEHDNPLTTIPVERTEGGEITQYYNPYVVMKNVTVTQASSFTEPVSRLHFSFTSSTAGTGYIDWIEVQYSRQLAAEGDVFHFHAHDTTAVTSYSIGGFSAGTPVRVFDVTRFDSVVHVVNPIVSNGRCTFQTQLLQGTSREFIVVGNNGFRAPSLLQSFANQDLHGDTTDVDLIIISHRDFLPAASRLKAYREQPGPDRLTTRVVDVEQVYNEFSGGYLSPVGIRNYLMYLSFRYAAGGPKYVLLFGDGDYDYKRISTTGPNWIPVWATYESFAIMPLLSYATEDSLTVFPGSEKVQAGVGRLPVRSLGQAQSTVDKIIEYETTFGADPWKIRATFVADDFFEEGTVYTSQSEILAENYTPTLFEKQKIYEAEYPLLITPVGQRRPSVNQAIVDKINQGTLTLNFIGHGNPRLWTHEQIFVRENDFPRLANKGKYCIVVAATCNYSQHDNPFDQSGGEQLVVKQDAGAIATISASRPVFAGDNFNFNTTLYQFMFQTDTLGRVVPTRLGDAFYKTKQLRSSGFYDNDKKFLLLGDPSLRVAIPRRSADVDSVNGLPGNTVVQVRALDTAVVVAKIRDQGLSQLSNFTGSSLVSAYDADRRVTISTPNNGSFTYNSPGGVIFRGQSRVDSGRLASTFIIPKDISYDTTRPARISLFFWNNAEDGAGVTRNIRVGGTNPNPSADSTGPRIRLYLDSRNFRPGDLVSDNPLFIADLFDEHGINSSNIGIGHRLEAWIDDRTESVDLSDYYKGTLDSFQEGTVEYVLNALAPGPHRIRFRAWDTYNNSSAAETNFDVGVVVGIKVFNVFNYPNPFTTATTFTFQHNQYVPVDAEVKIYSVAGRLLETLEQKGAVDQFVTISWNGRDRDGDEVANGVYLYKLTVHTQDGRFRSEELGKLSKVR